MDDNPRSLIAGLVVRLELRVWGSPDSRLARALGRKIAGLVVRPELYITDLSPPRGQARVVKLQSAEPTSGE
ncbi:MAG: hypothetical protein PVH03_14825 [Chloroflexota bacterium]